MADPSKVRLARLDDVHAIYETIKENPTEVLPRSFQDIWMHFDRFHVYDDGGIKGVISWQALPLVNPDHPDRCLEIISFSVKDAEKKKGIGAALLKHMLELLSLYEPDRLVVLTFYPEYFKNFGFKETSKEKLYQKILVGCLNCTKYKSPLTCPEVAMEYIPE